MIVSTFPPAECGIGNYTQQLVHALARRAPALEVVIVAEHATQAPFASGVVRAWHRREDWGPAIAREVERLHPDVVHVQHEESILGQDRRLPRLLAELHGRGIATAVTLHTVHEGARGRSFHRRLAASCDRLVVHQHTGMADVLASHGVRADQVEVIAHGTPELELPDQATARALLDLPRDVPIALFFGFIHFRKRLHVAISAFDQVADRVEGARFVIAGRLRHSHVLDALYAASLRRVMRPGLRAGRLIYRPGFVPDALKAAYYAAADLIVLPHDQPYGSASGVLHEALAARRPVLCTRGNKFAEAVDALAATLPEAFPRPGDTTAWRRGFERLLPDPQRRARMTALLHDLAHETSWSVSADRHASMYRAIARGTQRLVDVAA